jgi:hypothetical protein
MPRVNPAILSWARETAGLSTDEAARKLDRARRIPLAALHGSKTFARHDARTFRGFVLAEGIAPFVFKATAHLRELSP